TRIILDGLATLLSPHVEQLEEERREHLHIFNLLGDPMLRLNYPQLVKLDVPREARAGETLRISGHCAIGGRGVLELVCRRDHSKHEPPIGDRFDPTDKALAEFQPVYEQSLDRCWARWSIELPEGDFTTQVVLPPGPQGPCHLCLAVANQQSHAIGATNIQ